VAPKTTAINSRLVKGMGTEATAVTDKGTKGVAMDREVKVKVKLVPAARAQAARKGVKAVPADKDPVTTMPTLAALLPQLLHPQQELAVLEAQTPATTTTMVAQTTMPVLARALHLRHRPPRLVQPKVAVHPTQLAPTKVHKVEEVVAALVRVDQVAADDTGTSSLHEVSHRSD
jgi:hypothetical protein